MKMEANTIEYLTILAHIVMSRASFQCCIGAHSTGNMCSEGSWYVLPPCPKSHILTGILGGSVGNTLNHAPILLRAANLFHEGRIYGFQA
jgi:hypothetical protein